MSDNFITICSHLFFLEATICILQGFVIKMQVQTEPRSPEHIYISLNKQEPTKNNFEQSTLNISNGFGIQQKNSFAAVYGTKSIMQHYLLQTVPSNDTQHNGLNTFSVRPRKFSSILKAIKKSLLRQYCQSLLD